ncbi:hypothetical protein FACS1894202_09250 [Clostridia bacterium]|nr:hypothetical protein FACS1894202_09250 [Clostridia bacterium]
MKLFSFAKGERVKKPISRKRKIVIIATSSAAVVIAAFAIWLSTQIQLPPVIDNPFDSEEVELPPVNPGSPSSQSSTKPNPSKDIRYKILLSGLDESKYNTDTIMIADVNCTKKTLNILSIPRDTYSATAKRSLKKINGAYAGKDIERFKSELKDILGFAPDYYVLVDFDAVKEFVDLIGGVDFYIESDMKYDKYLKVSYKKGEHHLDGKNALNVLRYRSGYITADINRMSVQQKLLKAVVKQAISVENIFKIPQLPEIINKNVKSDLTWGQMVALGATMRDIDTETGIKTATLPTKTGEKEYQMIIESEARPLIEEFFK